MLQWDVFPLINFIFVARLFFLSVVLWCCLSVCLRLSFGLVVYELNNDWFLCVTFGCINVNVKQHVFMRVLHRAGAAEYMSEI